jgi:hypothetical protein
MEWTSPWEPVEDLEIRGRLERQLRRELPPHHVLAHLDVTAIARQAGADGVIFVLADGRVAQVHLTWSESPPASNGPAVRLCGSLAAWREAGAA